MDESLKDLLRKGEKQHKQYLRWLHTGISLEKFAKRGIKPMENSYLVAGLRVVLRLFILLLLKMVAGKFLYAFVVLIALHIVAHVVGKKLHNVYDVKLWALESEYRLLQTNYAAAKDDEYGIRGEMVFYDDGTVVSSGFVSAPMERDYGDIRIYNLENGAEAMEFQTRKYNQEERDKFIVTDTIASVEFTRKYGAITQMSNKLNSINYFSPKQQLDMIKTPEIKQFTGIQITPEAFHAHTQIEVAPYAVVDAFARKSFLKYFADVDRYCQEVKKMGETVHTAILAAKFMLGEAE